MIRLVVSVLAAISLAHPSLSKVQSKLKCGESWMAVELKIPEDTDKLYLEGLKGYPDEACKAQMSGNMATFNLSLADVYQCGVTRIINQHTGMKLFYHRIVMETSGSPKEFLTVKCIQSGNHTIFKRNVLPAGFQEPIELTTTSSVTKLAPQPKLQVGVRQAGQLVTGELNVNPGTPLQMEIYLDKESAPIYGILVSYMQVSDTKHQQESIIFNGCSVDPYLFENFNTVDGDFLSAKFRAFKFPDSTYVQFKGTVNVCLNKCRGVECSNNQIGYGRRKREIPEMPHDPNKVFEVSITSFYKVNYKGDMLDKVKFDLGPDPQDLGDKGTSVQEIQNPDSTKGELKFAEESKVEDLLYTILEDRNAASSIGYSSLAITLTVSLFAMFL